MKPLVSSAEKPDDYDNDLSRGTVDFDPSWRNYSYYTVNIPKGTVVCDCNFTQASPLTDAIPGDHEITFKDCNLVNVLLSKKWKIIDCNTSQSWLTTEVKDGVSIDKRIKVDNIDPYDDKQKLKEPYDVLKSRGF